jgi:hypothetical protein
MTKSEIKILKEHEARAWLAIAEYDAKLAPVVGTLDDFCNWDITDAGHIRCVSAWAAVNDLMAALGVLDDHDRPEHEKAMELMHDLSQRRRDANGKYY